MHGWCLSILQNKGELTRVDTASRVGLDDFVRVRSCALVRYEFPIIWAVSGHVCRTCLFVTVHPCSTNLSNLSESINSVHGHNCALVADWDSWWGCSRGRHYLYYIINLFT
jgi:hypothetical protein